MDVKSSDQDYFSCKSALDTVSQKSGFYLSKPTNILLSNHSSLHLIEKKNSVQLLRSTDEDRLNYTNKYETAHNSEN